MSSTRPCLIKLYILAITMKILLMCQRLEAKHTPSHLNLQEVGSLSCVHSKLQQC